MEKKLAIKGHSTRGKKVIELLEMMGGKNKWLYEGSDGFVYFIKKNDNYITYCGKECIKNTGEYIIYELEEFLEKYPYKVGDIVKTGKDEEGVIKQMRWVDNDIVYWVNSHETCDWTQTLSVDVLDKYNRLNLNDIEYSMETKIESTGFMQLGKTVAVIFNDANYEDEVELQLGDYEIEERDGKIYAVKKKPIYPKSYGECCDVIGYDPCEDEINCYKSGLIESFVRLLICRDAYWKIAGKQMGLGKPWEPDWNNTANNFVIQCMGNKVEFWLSNRLNYILVFPTVEIRDAFHENFKDLIEKCKKLL